MNEAAEAAPKRRGRPPNNPQAQTIEPDAGLAPPRQAREPSREPARGAVTRLADGRHEVVGRDGQVLRRNRLDTVDNFYVPPHIIPEGWDYNWKVTSVHGEPQTSKQVSYWENGWRPVPASRHEGIFMPPGFKGNIERDGQILMERPLILSQEASYEEKRKADGLVNAQKELTGQFVREAGFDDGKENPNARATIRTKYERAPVPVPSLEIANE